MYNVKTSNLPSCQQWIKQFTPEDRADAKLLLDELIYIETSSVIDEITSEIKKIIKEEKKVSIVPIREVFTNEISYYDLNNKDINPDMNIPDEPLGSEALISNLITRLRRGYGKSVVLEYNKTTKSNKSPSISCMIKEKVKALILVDDVIGSGKRTVDFFNIIYNHKTIKSWVSNGTINIYIISYMATDKGLDYVKKNIKGNIAKVVHLNRCPTFFDSQNSDRLSCLCERYSHKNEENPLGFRNSFVKVIFEHSAPNNIPKILYKNTDNYKAHGAKTPSTLKSWIALFPSRYVQPSFTREMSASNNGINMKSAIKCLLHIMNGVNISTIESLVRLTRIEKVKIKHYLNVCNELGILEVKGNVVKVTVRSKNELHSLTRDRKYVEINKELYYPRV